MLARTCGLAVYTHLDLPSSFTALLVSKKAMLFLPRVVVGISAVN